MPGQEAAVEYYLNRLGIADSENAWHSLIDMGPAILPQLCAAYRRESDPGRRAALLSVIWESRCPALVPLLAEALDDTAPPVWKEALNGLVAIAGPDVVRALESALSRADRRGPEAPAYREWVEEALEQARERPGDPSGPEA